MLTAYAPESFLDFNALATRRRAAQAGSKESRFEIASFLRELERGLEGTAKELLDAELLAKLRLHGIELESPFN